MLGHERRTSGAAKLREEVSMFADDRLYAKDSTSEQEEPFCFRVEMDKVGQPQILCLDGKETIASVALTGPGLNRLIEQQLMRKPNSWKVGALRNWVELDGAVFKFQ